MTEIYHNKFIQEITWDEARPSLHKLQPELTNIIDKIGPSREHTFFKVRYYYGMNILKHGIFYLPKDNGELKPLTDFPPEIRSKLDYNLYSNPVTAILNNSVELFLSFEDRVIPLYSLIHSGKVFGAWRVTKKKHTHHPKFIWDMTAGARSIFMLPKIQKAVQHTNLIKRWRITADVPKQLMDHWYIFKQIAQSPHVQDKWYTELLFFTSPWFEHLDDSAWEPFNYFILKQSWESSDFWRSEFIWNIVLSLIQQRRMIRPNAYIANIIKYLLGIAAGATPGFAPAVDDTSGPIELIQTAYIEDYHLQEYAPIIMHPKLFDLYSEDSEPVYYGLQFPIAYEFAMKSSERQTVISELYSTKLLMDKYLNEIREGNFALETTPLHDLTELAEFNYYHNDVSDYRGLLESQDMPLTDKRFCLDKFKNDKFPNSSSFVKGCVKIQKKINNG
ncbi:MAG: hypothetical protein KIT27_04195 [Legionellales bacterium]|nr:hypothetical protein [Legionellales bacterium]